MMLLPIEALRASFRPDKIQVLFVGESAPVSGDFFYAGDTGMKRYMSRAFGEPPDFLEWFKGQGYYLDDLVLEPIDHWTRAERTRAHRQWVPSLAARVADYEPGQLSRS